MRIGVLFSGGKDSSLALSKATQYQEVVCLISIISKNQESYMFHVPNIKLTKIQAESAGLPLIQMITKGEKENELKDLKKAIQLAKKKFKIEGIATGAIRSIYQATRIQRICKELGIWCFNPLWLKDQIELLNELVENNFQVIITGVFAYPLDESFLGKEIDDDMIKTLEHLMERYDLNPAGEGGEIETTVIDAPFFAKKIEILEYETSYSNNRGVFKIRKARLSTK